MKWPRKFQVSKNRFTSLEGLRKLTELRHLNIADKELEHLPEDIGNLKLLRACDFSRNRLRNPAEGFGGSLAGYGVPDLTTSCFRCAVAAIRNASTRRGVVPVFERHRRYTVAIDLRGGRIWTCATNSQQ